MAVSLTGSGIKQDTIFEHWAHDHTDTYWSSLLLYCCDITLPKSSSWEGRVSAYSLQDAVCYYRGARASRLLCACACAGGNAGSGSVLHTSLLFVSSCLSLPSRAGITSLNHHTWRWSQLTELTVRKKRTSWNLTEMLQVRSCADFCQQPLCSSCHTCSALPHQTSLSVLVCIIGTVRVSQSAPDKETRASHVGEGRRTRAHLELRLHLLYLALQWLFLPTPWRGGPFSASFRLSMFP